MAIYSIDKSTPTVSADLRTTSASSPDTLIAPSHVLEVVIENMCVHAPPPKPDKGTTLTDQPLPGENNNALIDSGRIPILLNLGQCDLQEKYSKYAGF